MFHSRLLLASSCLFLFTSACSNKGNAPGAGVAIDLPIVTKPVGGAAASSITPMATTGAKLNAPSCSLCAGGGGGGGLSQVYGLASIFVQQGKFADGNSCTIAAIAEAGVVPGLTDGEVKYLNTGGLNLKVQIEADGSELKSFKVYTCENGTQRQYIAGTNVGGAVTFTFRSDGTSGGVSSFMAMDATGHMSGGNWTSKNLKIGFYTNSGYSFSDITQTADYLDVVGGTDTGTLGTLDGADDRLVARVQLIGNSLDTYAIGDGSILKATGNASSTTQNWNGDTGTHGAGPTTYDSVVSSATLPTIPTTRATAFTADETWNCQAAGEEINLIEKAASNPSLMAKVMACQESFE